MKDKKVSFFSFMILFIIKAILVAGLIFLGYIVYIEIFNTDVKQTIHTKNTDVAVDDGISVSNTEEKKSIGETILDIFTTSSKTEEYTYSDEESVGKFFYEQLNENQKIIYNGLQENKDKLMSGNYIIHFGNKFSATLEKEDGGKILGDDYQTAIEAFTHDNPDLFYLDISKMYLNMETKKKVFKTTYNVYIQPEESRNYYAEGFNSELDVRKALNRIEQERDYIKSKLTGKKYNDIKIIHDYLVDNVEYDKDSKSSNTYTIYGALIEKKCVCEGYARAFKYLADMAGINCVLMQGTATNTDGTTENHAWNTVKLNGSWYLIDTTWDDPIIIGGGIVFSSVHYKYFLKGTRTFDKDHTVERQFTEGGKIFNYPNISYKDY